MECVEIRDMLLIVELLKLLLEKEVLLLMRIVEVVWFGDSH